MGGGGRPVRTAETKINKTQKSKMMFMHIGFYNWLSKGLFQRVRGFRGAFDPLGIDLPLSLAIGFPYV